MQEHGGLFCKTGKLWITGKFRRPGKILNGPKLGVQSMAQQQGKNEGAQAGGLTQWASARSKEEQDGLQEGCAGRCDAGAHARAGRGGT